MPGGAPGQVREETARRLSEPTESLPSSFLSRSLLQAGTAFRGGRLALFNALRKNAIDSQSVQALASSLASLKGVPMKMGQILGYFDVDLPAEVRSALSVLQTHAHPLPFEKIQAVIRRELPGRSDELLGQMVPEPIAVASIGQVHRTFLPAGHAVAVKVQYPGIEKAIKADTGQVAVGAAFASFLLPGAKLRSFVGEARTRFLEECDYRLEAQRQRRFQELFAHHPTIIVPRVHLEHSSSHVLTTTLAEGVHLDEYLARDPSQAARDRAGTALFEFYLGTLFKYGLYNCDPHPGNYLFRDDGRVVMLDHGCAREFEPGFVDQLATLTEAGQADDPGTLAEVMVDMGILRPKKRHDPDALRAVVHSLFGPMFDDETRAIEPGQARIPRRKLIKLGLPGEFLFLLRVRFGLAAVLARLGARANWYRLEREFIAARPIRASGRGVTFFDVILSEVGDNEIAVIRAVRAATGQDLKQVKALVDTMPQAIKRSLSRQDAEALFETLQAAGGTIEIRPSGGFAD